MLIHVDHRMGSPANASSPTSLPPLDERVRAELVRTAYDDAIYGAPFAAIISIILGVTMLSAFTWQQVLPWAVASVACNGLRLYSRWAYQRGPVPLGETAKWERIFVVVSASTGLCGGMGSWLFYGADDPIYRTITVLVLAGLTTGAARLLAPIFWANVIYLYGSVAPLLFRFIEGQDVRGYAIGAMCLAYLGYMTFAARAQVRSLRRAVRLGFENMALVKSLGAARDSTDQLNRGLTAEIERRILTESELRSASERAEAASRAKSEFLATMSHEIRTPMNGIIGMLRVVRESPLSAEQREQLGTAAGSADSLLDLINDILDFSKIEAGRLDLETIAFAPAPALKGVADLLRPRAEAKGLAFVVELDPRLPGALRGDPTRLRQVLFNLVGNALKFTERGRVVLRVWCDELAPDAATVTFAVTDSGIGMDAEAVGRLFNAFTQADSSMSRRYGGSGLGLAISQKLVEAMGGKIAVDTMPGRGSRFHFTLRFDLATVADAAQLTAETKVRFVAPVLRGRVLVAEDDRVNQRVIGHFLKQMGLVMELAEDGHTAVELAATRPVDLVLMDLQMPGLDGLDATRRLRERLAGRALPVVALTANASTEDRAACFAAGMDDFLTKPIRLEVLAATLQKWLPAAPHA